MAQDHKTLSPQPVAKKKKSNNFIVQICNSDTSFSGNKYIKCMNLLTWACSILLANSCAAKPPNTTEWIAPSRAQANMAITAWNKNSEFSIILVRTIFLWEAEATLLFN